MSDLTTKQWDVLAFGAVAVDDLLYVDHHPAPDSKIPVRQRQREGGGLAGTALVAAARLGATAAYAGVLGDDDLSHFSLDQFRREGVDCSLVLQQPEARPHYSVIVVDKSSGGRCILAMRDGVRGYPSSKITPSLIEQARVLFIDHTCGDSGVQAAQLAHACGIPIVADIERLEEPGVEAMLGLTDHLIISLEVGRRLSGENKPEHVLLALEAPKRQCCVLTDGANGSWFLPSGGSMQHLPAFSFPVVDTTGCGDVFHGAYAASVAREESIERAVLVATAAAGLKTLQPGGRRGIPDRSALEKFLAEGHETL